MQSRIPLAVGIVAAGAMVIAIIYGMASGGFADGLRAVLDDPWGRVTLVDLAAGLFLAGAWIRWREGSSARAIPWWIAMVLTGNLATGIYVIRAAVTSHSVSEFLIGESNRPLV